MLDEFATLTTPRNIESQSYDQLLTEDDFLVNSFSDSSYEAMNQAIQKLIVSKLPSLILFEKVIAFPACDLLSTELWPSLQDKIQEYLQAQDLEIAKKALNFCTILFENASGSQIGEVFIMFVKGLEKVKMNVHFDSHSMDNLNSSNLPIKTNFLLNCGKVLFIMLKTLPTYWLYFSDILMKDIYYNTVNMISNHFQLLIIRLNEHPSSMPVCIFSDQNCHLFDVDLFHSLIKTSPFFLLCIVDPIANWFENWLQTSISRDSLFSFLSHSQLPKIFQLVIVKFMKSRDVLSRLFLLHILNIFWKIVEYENGKKIFSGETFDYFSYFSEYFVNNSNFKLQFKVCNWSMPEFWKSIRFGVALKDSTSETFALITGFDYILNIMDIGKIDLLDLYYLNSLSTITLGIYNLLLNCNCYLSCFDFILTNLLNTFKRNAVVFAVVILSRVSHCNILSINHKCSQLQNLLQNKCSLDFVSSLNFFVSNALELLIYSFKLDDERLIYPLDSIIDFLLLVSKVHESEEISKFLSSNINCTALTRPYLSYLLVRLISFSNFVEIASESNLDIVCCAIKYLICSFIKRDCFQFEKCTKFSHPMTYEQLLLALGKLSTYQKGLIAFTRINLPKFILNHVFKLFLMPNSALLDDSNKIECWSVEYFNSDMQLFYDTINYIEGVEVYLPRLIPLLNHILSANWMEICNETSVINYMDELLNSLNIIFDDRIPPPGSWNEDLKSFGLKLLNHLLFSPLIASLGKFIPQILNYDQVLLDDGVGIHKILTSNILNYYVIGKSPILSSFEILNNEPDQLYSDFTIKNFELTINDEVCFDLSNLENYDPDSQLAICFKNLARLCPDNIYSNLSNFINSYEDFVRKMIPLTTRKLSSHLDSNYLFNLSLKSAKFSSAALSYRASDNLYYLSTLRLEDIESHNFEQYDGNSKYLSTKINGNYLPESCFWITIGLASLFKSPFLEASCAAVFISLNSYLMTHEIGFDLMKLHLKQILLLESPIILSVLEMEGICIEFLVSIWWKSFYFQYLNVVDYSKLFELILLKGCSFLVYFTVSILIRKKEHLKKWALEKCVFVQLTEKEMVIETAVFENANLYHSKYHKVFENLITNP